MSDVVKLLSISGLLILTFLSCSDCEEPVQDIDACVDVSVDLTQDFESYVEFSRNKAKWDCLNYSHYSYEFVSLNQVCYGQNIYVEVKDKVVIDSIVMTGGNGPKCGQADFIYWFTIDEIYNRIEESVDSSVQFSHPFYQEGKNFALADRVVINYDSLTGLPTYGSIDYHIGIADEEYSWKILNFSGVR